jgi:hypothetical protein
MTVSPDPAVVESQLAGGGLACPWAGCGGVLRRWWFAEARAVEVGLGGRGERVSLRPRRARCGSCGRTQTLLAAGFVARRMDSGEVIGRALELSARGLGCRRIAAVLGRPESTARGWVAGAKRAAVPVGVLAAALAVSLAGDAASVSPGSAPGPLGRYAAAGMALAAALAALWGAAPPRWFDALTSACGCWPLDVGRAAQREPASVAAGLAAGSWAGGPGGARPPPGAPRTARAGVPRTS